MAKYKIIPSSRTIVQSPISIGHKAEKGVEAIEFDVTAWVETYGSGTLTVIMRRWGDAIPYPIALEIDEDNKATWTLSDTDTAKAGMAYAQLNYIVGETVVKKSDIYTFRVMDSLTGEGEPPEAYESWLEHLTRLAAEAMAEVLDIEGVVTDKTLSVEGGIADAKAAGDALALKADKSTTYTKTEVDALIDEVEVETDTTLSVSGAPADAKKTGDELSALKADLVDLQEGGYVADAQQIQTKINAWLSNHPEATTTVKDGSLTESKFSTTLKLSTIKDYVTPEMYGAKGDGIIDDTIALENAILTGTPVLLSKKYKITRMINLPAHTTLFGNKADSEIICHSNSNLFGVSSDCHVSGIIIRVQTGFSGSVFIIDDTTLTGTDITITNLCTNISNIDVYVDGIINKHSSIFELSLTNGYYNASNALLSGFYGVSINQINVKSNPSNLLGYLYKSYVKGTTLWITGIDIANCNVYGARWSVFLGESDEAFYDANVTGASTTVNVENCQHQKTTTNCVGFAYARKDSKLKITNCIPWDWESYDANTIPYLVAKDAYENTVYTIKMFPEPRPGQVGVVNNDGTFSVYGYDDLNTINTLGITQFDVRLIPRVYYTPSDKQVALLYRGNASANANFSVVFKYCKFNTWVNVAINIGTSYVNSPKIAIDGDVSQSDKFYVKNDNNVVSLYLKTSAPRQMLLMSEPIFGALSYSGENIAATHYATINVFNLTDAEKFLSSVPDGAIEITDVTNWSHGLCLRSPNNTLYKLKVADDGTLSTQRWYNGYDYVW